MGLISTYSYPTYFGHSGWIARPRGLGQGPSRWLTTVHYQYSVQSVGPIAQVEAVSGGPQYYTGYLLRSVVVRILAAGEDRVEIQSAV